MKIPFFNKEKLEPMFSVVVNGINFLVDFDGKRERHGFFTSVWVSAKDSDEAEKKAVEILKNDSHLRAITLNPIEDPPILFQNGITKVKRNWTTKGKEDTRIGLAWYSEDIPEKKPE